LVFYDPEKQCLVYLSIQSSKFFWDNHWRSEIFKMPRTRDRFVVRVTKKFLPTGSKVLDGGCGRGQIVWSLADAGYHAYGIDYASETVASTKHFIPELNVLEGDVRNLPFKSNSFDGYWSLGVIEHFFDGYNDIMKEMFRVLRPGGFAFVTFPSMSLLRKVKVKLGCYPVLKKDETSIRRLFYQYALNEVDVLINFTKLGFEIVDQRRIDGTKGLKDEIMVLKAILQPIYDGRSLPVKLTRKLLDCGSRRWCGHMSFMILSKNRV
jgi:ubiquinone/menaquinone biosynthesis C-methylase UbiE